MKKLWLALCLTGMTGVLIPAMPVTAMAAPAGIAVPLKRTQITALAESVADYQLATLASGYVPPKAAWETPHPKGWVQAVFFIGLTDLAERSARPIYKQAVLSRGQANNWEPDKRLYHADDHAIGQTYLWASRHGAGSEAVAPLKASFDKILARPSKVPLGFNTEVGVDCLTRWCWCDALFMAPPAWLELSKVTGDPKYAEFAKAEFHAATDYLYDRQEHLYFRDSRFFERRGPNGEKVFWSRGNGWVFGGLARMIPLLPEGDPGRREMEVIYKEMAAKIIAIQKPDGYWAPSLLADPATALPESSGTAFYVYGLAWGIKAGLLDRKAYEPAVRKGWDALVGSVQPSGKFGYVQPIGDQPDNVGPDDTQYYGVGAFLLAAGAVADLEMKP